MRLATTLLILALSFPVVLLAQEGEAAVESPVVVPVSDSGPESDAAPGAAEQSPATSGAVAEPAGGNHEVRTNLHALLRDHPPELRQLLTLEPALLSNAEFLTRYPELAAFLAGHPEIRRNPHFYLPPYETARRSPLLADIAEMMTVFASFLLVALALGWLVRTLIEQKRWNRLSRTQTEVHNKILDRFGTSDELLAYVKSPAGSRFLESAPIPLHADRPAAQSPPLPRTLWSVQIGVVVAAGALGMLLVSLRSDAETAQALFALGAIGLCLGAGFIASAVVSMILSRRLGLWAPPAGSGGAGGPGAAERLDDTGLVG
ncbi:MAG TPA: hypothetical protein VHQ65_14460 [Thermoanaerobaculia bacterium]|nr:hypothetical protein [Thermoanaerobaculia bacterium]